MTKKTSVKSNYVGDGRKSCYDEYGREIVDPTPMVIPLDHEVPETTEEKIRRMVKGTFSKIAEDHGLETEEEANDFNVGDDYEDDPLYPDDYPLDKPKGRLIEEEIVENEDEGKDNRDDSDNNANNKVNNRDNLQKKVVRIGKTNEKGEMKKTEVKKIVRISKTHEPGEKKPTKVIEYDDGSIEFDRT